MLSVLTLNLGAAARPRAEALLGWLSKRSEDVLLLTETSAGPGTAYLLDQFRQGGWTVIKAADEGDRGAALVSRAKTLAADPRWLAGVSVPGRVAACLLDSDPQVFVVSVYVPSRDRSESKTARKQMFIATLLDALDALPSDLASHTVLGGDYNVIARDHQPRHRGFLPFEYGLLERLEASGYADAYARVHPGEQAHSWIGRTGDGYRYDYLHTGVAVAGLVSGCRYLHETREGKLTDHAAVTMSLRVVPKLLATADPSSVGALF
ncbi:hypothetical protein E1264_36980 [Actinomadura sp. KC216]|uniref:endonuclease/exonuclease/phosphatase family protein n=1 Tax=Actinomadura sp. KC216 TaxID=2530370 RepID=UPI00104E3708|nr:endonuclease/exonuclease/phosphatase family protein [Actinomadura sp. KC216]TDB78193.1 hypothetical protein E1264_36980 [Actinomadura sp. KC216]